jgi:hypothetical protein
MKKKQSRRYSIADGCYLDGDCFDAKSQEQKPQRGRPATERGPYSPNPARQFGRISDDDWNELKAAADAAGQSMVEWALPTLLKKARRESKKAK